MSGMTTLLWLIRTAITSRWTTPPEPFVLDQGRQKSVYEVGQIAMEQADWRMHQYFAIDQVGQDTWFQPVEELIGRPEFVCDGSRRWHEKIILTKALPTENNRHQGTDYLHFGCSESRISVKLSRQLLKFQFSAGEDRSLHG
jgi:hypothetical protein